MATTNEINIQTAAKMYECRDAARQILGSKYQGRMNELGKVLEAVAERDRCNHIVAGTTAIKDAGLTGIDALMLIAAVVEITEPSA